ncbi:MAG TPA: type I-E CRISPR-associated protein Cas5/CasD [Methylocystis sp.]
MQLCLILRLEAPLVAFGDIMVDAIGPVSDLPSASMLTGLIGNALGWRREEKDRLQRLQDRLIYAARLDRRTLRITEFQTAELDKNDEGWTTRGRPEGRAGGDGTYAGPHIRYREYDCDVSVVAALRLAPAGEYPDLETIAHALVEPFRPLFIGRKSCLPAAPIFERLAEADTLLQALRTVPLAAERKGQERRVLVELPYEERPPDGERFLAVHRCDRRDWRAGVHAGDTLRWSGFLSRTVFVDEAATR